MKSSSKFFQVSTQIINVTLFITWRDSLQGKIYFEGYSVFEDTTEWAQKLYHFLFAVVFFFVKRKLSLHEQITIKLTRTITGGRAVSWSAGPIDRCLTMSERQIVHFLLQAFETENSDYKVLISAKNFASIFMFRLDKLALLQ